MAAFHLAMLTNSQVSWRPPYHRALNFTNASSASDSLYKYNESHCWNRWEQVTVFSLRTSHNHLNRHPYSKLRSGHTEQCPCSTGSQTTQHLLQSCPLYELLRKGIWPDPTQIARKLYSSLGDLWCTATFIEKTWVSIWQMRSLFVGWLLNVPATC